MSSQGDGIGEGHPIADMAVMRDVRIGHEIAAVSNARYAAALNRAAIHRNAFPDHVIGADLGLRARSRIAAELRAAAKNGVRVDARTRAELRFAHDHHVRIELDAVAQTYARPHEAERSDFD